MTNSNRELVIQYRSVATLLPYARNARTHSKHQIRQIAASIKAFGFTNPILISGENNIIAGHGRVSAAKLLGIEFVPTIRLDNMTQEQIRAYVIADNRLAEKAGWDKSILAIELQHLLTIDDDFEVTITGFEVPEIDLILQEASATKVEDELIAADLSQPAITQNGDLWMLGSHLILCGNALVETSYSALLGTRKADLVFIDPPYNVTIDGNVCGKGSIRHREFAMAFYLIFFLLFFAMAVLPNSSSTSIVAFATL